MNNLKQLLNDPKKGFEAYLATRQIQIKTQEVDYPDKTKVETQSAVPETAKTGSVENQTSEKEAAEIKPNTTPDSTPGQS